jgi:hypothetical protein
MSYEPSHSTDHLPPPEAQADEQIASAKIWGIGIAALIVFALATWWSTSLLRGEQHTLEPRGPIAPGSEVGKPEIGIVDQTPFETNRSAERARHEQMDWLGKYGWIDQRKGTIHVPIDRAIDAYLQQQKARTP